MNYGCLPIVSNVSAIGQYIKDNENGFLLKNLNVDSLYVNFINLLELEEVAYRQMITSAGKFMKAFTYTNYNQRILKEIL
jgi:glycosyltransferase involved in cell wall biosynthesis